VIDAPEGGGKVPILPNYMLSMSDTKVIVRNYEGFITAYTQPTNYQGHNPATCSYCQSRRNEAGQKSIAGLLSGQRREIAPQQWHETHARIPQTPTPSPFVVQREMVER
jgi:lysine 2,3-aminomutase